MTVEEINLQQQEGWNRNFRVGTRTWHGDNATCKTLVANLNDTAYDADVSSAGVVTGGSAEEVAVSTNIMASYDDKKGRGVVIAQYVQPTAVSIREKNKARIYVQTVNDYEKIIYDRNGLLIDGTEIDSGALKIWKPNFDNRRPVGKKALIVASTAVDASTFSYTNEVLAKQGHINDDAFTIGSHCSFAKGEVLFVGLRDTSFQAVQPDLIWIDYVFLFNVEGWNDGAKRQRYSIVGVEQDVYDSAGVAVSPPRKITIRKEVPVDNSGDPSSSPYEQTILPYPEAEFDFSGYTTW
jgi:hypothetical protein